MPRINPLAISKKAGKIGAATGIQQLIGTTVPEKEETPFRRHGLLEAAAYKEIKPADDMSEWNAMRQRIQLPALPYVDPAGDEALATAMSSPGQTFLLGGVWDLGKAVIKGIVTNAYENATSPVTKFGDPPGEKPRTFTQLNPLEHVAEGVLRIADSITFGEISNAQRLMFENFDEEGNFDTSNFLGLGVKAFYLMNN